jgi:hypothetical protein
MALAVSGVMYWRWVTDMLRMRTVDTEHNRQAATGYLESVVYDVTNQL